MVFPFVCVFSDGEKYCDDPQRLHGLCQDFGEDDEF